MGVGIEVINLNAWYGSNHTLQDINLHIPASQATALIGPSGCGKSTFVRCLNRMHETNPIARVTGTVRIGELDIYEQAAPVWALPGQARPSWALKDRSTRPPYRSERRNGARPSSHSLTQRETSVSRQSQNRW